MAKGDGTRATTVAAFGPAAAIGLLAGGALCLSAPALWPVLLLLPLLAVGALVWGRCGGARRLLGVALVGFAWTGLHAAYALSRQLPPEWERRQATVSGRIVEMPVHELRRTRLLFRVDDSDDQVPPLRGRLLRLSWYSDDRVEREVLRAGQRWRWKLRLRAPRGLRNPGGPDAEKYALMQGLSANGYLVAAERAQLLAPAGGLEALRERLSDRIRDAVAVPSSRYVRALALGDTRALGERDWEVLRANGLTHLIAISGFHVGLVAGFFALIVRGLWRLRPELARRWPRPIAAASAAAVGALLYAALAGFALPTVRTLLMIAVVAGVRLSRRPFEGAGALALAAIAVLLVDPLAVLGAGFWLSFLGVAWLLWCLPRSGPRPSPLREFLSAQGVATLGLLPACVALFGQASLAGPLANLLAVPWWSLVVVPLALIGTGLDLLWTGAGEGAWRLAAFCFDLSWPCFERLAAGRLALWWLPEPPWFALPLALLGAFWLLLPRGVPGKPLALLLWLPLLWPDRHLPQPGEAELTVIDVGQGLSVHLRTAHHELLYDFGPAVADGYDAGERAVLPTLRARGVRSLDRLIVSHGDNDHAGGLEAVARAFPGGERRAPEGAGIAQARPCVAGEAWTWDGVRFRFLHPPPHFPYLRNESSCVLRIDTAHGAVLLTGDIGEVVERDLVRRDRESGRRDLRAEVVLVAHHGSRSSSDPAFVAATGARHALISSGYGNRYGHPKPQVLARWRAAGARVWDTSRGGALRLRLAAGGPALETRRQAHPRLWDAARRVEAAPPGLSYRPD
ncbi:DNA internalization-related competence protein ComEC/Rec2 [Lysobacter sp. cf310]|uniref:DNA internalization-related competence protein ComEC/Rec2 n=1 Tax=Lysobacter sp. cf310 TaxID=1761790 RepID=UPI0008EDDEF7|nr:DNA internalization-related competence protein ComEC/Rec2 [Lysobacter sp. cf310]SFK65448.1 competence protein ComEC [Lysobacter sp. cf310]